MRIGKIPYLNSVLFYHGLERKAAAGGATGAAGNSSATSAATNALTLEPLVPRQLSGAVVENAIDAGPVPLVTCWDIEAAYEPFVVDGRGDFCIATVEKSHSILFFSKRPIDTLDGAAVGVTGETSTSVRLLKVLFAHYWRVSPGRYTSLDWPNNDAFLLIGDEALIHRRGIKDYPHVADLGEVWHKWTGLPFVFARWVARKSLLAADRLDLVDRIEHSIAEGWKHLDQAIEPWTHSLNMSPEEMRGYLEAFRFQMGDAEHAAVERFRQLDAAASNAGAARTT